MDIAIVYSLPSKRSLSTEYAAADEDSSVIARMVAKGLEAREMKSRLYPISEDEIASISEIKADCVFNLIEWSGQDIGLSIEAFKYLRNLNIPITGADEKMFVLTGDKIRVKQVLESLHAPTPMGAVFVIGDEPVPPSMTFPVIVKPSLEHCSMGLTNDSVVKTLDELRSVIVRQITSFNQPVLVEEFIVGRELLVYLVEVGNEIVVLPITEVTFEGANELAFQTYECKWVAEHPDYNSTFTDDAVLSRQEFETIEALCKKVFRDMGLRGYARFDLRLRDGVPYILETNANPSVYDATEESGDINEEIITGIQFPDYLKKIVDSAFYQFNNGRVI